MDAQLRPARDALIDSAAAGQVADGLMKQLAMSDRRLFCIPNLPLKGAAAEALKAAADRRGYWIDAARQSRPVLHTGTGEGSEAFQRMVSYRRRREADRQLRRLCEMGSVSFMTARSPTDVEAAFEIFIALEASGWKGKRGTALNRRHGIYEFAHAATMRLAQDGHAAIDMIRVGDRPIAALIRFEHGGLAIPWKIAYDEGFAAFSPGKQLMSDETRRWLSDASVVRVDPVCEEGNPLIAGLWSERERYGTLIVEHEPVGRRRPPQGGHDRHPQPRDAGRKDACPRRQTERQAAQAQAGCRRATLTRLSRHRPAPHRAPPRGARRRGSGGG